MACLTRKSSICRPKGNAHSDWHLVRFVNQPPPPPPDAFIISYCVELAMKRHLQCTCFIFLKRLKSPEKRRKSAGNDGYFAFQNCFYRPTCFTFGRYTSARITLPVLRLVVVCSTCLIRFEISGAAHKLFGPLVFTFARPPPVLRESLCRCRLVRPLSSCTHVYVATCPLSKL